MRAIVKVCGIRTSAELTVALAAGANAIGFNFYRRSPRYIGFEATPADVHSNRTERPYLRVGVFLSPSEQEIQEAVLAAHLDVVQIHGKFPSLVDLQVAGKVKLWRAIEAATAPPPEETAAAWVLDTPGDGSGGSGLSFDWRIATNFPGKVIVAGGLDASNVAEAVRSANPWGVDACSKLESAPGVKDPARVRAFVKEAWAALDAAAALTMRTA